MYQLFYASSAQQGLQHKDIERLLEKARQKNSQTSITGILLYHGGIFLQLLEGDREEVERLYAKILKDPRHKNITHLFSVESDSRIFKDWSMCFHELLEVDVKLVNQILYWSKRLVRDKVDNQLILEMIGKFRSYLPEEVA